MQSALHDIAQFLGISLGLLSVILVVIGLWFLRIVLRHRWVFQAQGPRTLPSHKLGPELWKDEAGYEAMLNRLHSELQEALVANDVETIEVISQGPAVPFFRERAQAVTSGQASREVLQGSIRQSWNADTETLTVILAVSRKTKGWRRYYEEWSIQRQGQGWFIVAAKPTKLEVPKAR